MATTEYTAVSLVKAYWTAQSINGSGYNVTGDAGNVAVGNVSGYNYVANQTTAVGQQITVNTTHAWNITGTTAADIIWGGAGSDTFTGQKTAGNDTIYGNGGKNVYDYTATTAANTVSLQDYVYGTDVVLGDQTVGAVAANFTSTGTVLVKGTATDGASVQLASESGQGYYNVTFKAGTNAAQGVWFGSTAASFMDASAQTAAVTMIGNNNDAADTLVGGKGADTIYAGSNDYVYGGAGNDSIVVTGSSNIVLGLASAGGADTIKGFKGGLAADGIDKLYLVDGNVTDLKVTYNYDETGEGEGNIAIALGSGKLVASDLEHSTGNSLNLAVQDSTKVWNVAIASTTKGSVILSDNGKLDDIYVGYNQTVANFSKQTTDTTSHLYDLSNSFGGEQKFYNIYALQASGNGDSLIGSTTMANSLAGGVGDDSLWGYGAKADTLKGAAGNNVFFYGTGDGKDVITDYTNTDGAADQVSLLSGSLTAVGRDAKNNMTLTLSSSDVLTVGTATASGDTVYNVAVGGTAYTAKVGLNGPGSTMTYSTAAEFYYGGNKNSSLTIADGEDYTINLGDGHFSNINSLDGNGQSGTETFFGNGSVAETLKGGSGTNSLWGGSGAVNDTLVGAGTTTYGFGKGDGNDVITGSGSDDTVLLYNVSLSDVSSAAVKSGAFVVSLTDGSSLTLKNYTADSANTFTLGDGTSWTYNYSKKNWTQKA